jgi:phenylpropionate dioxygenase-like ring-hydroxylating dioxygenase large terminal subunit
MPIRQSFLTQSQEGKPVAPLLGHIREYDGGIFGLTAFPNAAFVSSSDHAVLMRFNPIHTQLTDAEVSWLVREDAVEGMDYDVGQLTWLWKATCEQDFKLCEDNQEGVNSRHYEPGPFADVEGVESFDRWYLEQMRR